MFDKLGLARFRADQMLHWMYKQGVSNYGDMTNLPLALREQFSSLYPLDVPAIEDVRTSVDGTKKYLLRLADGILVETVGIPSGSERLTVCCSTQAGCAMGCAFCATGFHGLARDLLPGEIVDQVMIVAKDFSRPVTNVVAMGQGEPFANYDATLAALRILNNPRLGGIGARHFTVSTCGLFSGIDRFATEPEQFTLAVSLHAAQQGTRNRLMPRLAHQPLDALRAHLESYTEATGRRVTLEYALIKNVNEKAGDARALKRFCQGLLCHVNLIMLNAVNGSPFRPVSQDVLSAWLDDLNDSGITATRRASHGADILSACGQLANAHTHRA